GPQQGHIDQSTGQKAIEESQGQKGIRGPFPQGLPQGGPQFSQDPVQGAQQTTLLDQGSREQHQKDHQDADPYGEFLLKTEQGQALAQKTKGQPDTAVGDQSSQVVEGQLGRFLEDILPIEGQHKGDGATHAQAMEASQESENQS